jgi:thiosulfate dehydrogenase
LATEFFVQVPSHQANRSKPAMMEERPNFRRTGNGMLKRSLPVFLAMVPLLGAAASGYSATATTGGRLANQGAQGTPACATCHGQNGAGSAGIPRMAGQPGLAGQPAGYLEKQLRDFAAGKRQNTVMQSIAKTLNAAQIKAVAHYYMKLKTPSQTHVKASQAILDKGRELAVNGLWSKNVPACETCHGPGARGVPPHFPALAGQQPDYLAAQLRAWQKGQRSNGPNGLMKNVAEALSAEDVKAVSAYLASLPTEAESSAQRRQKSKERANDIAIAPAIADTKSGYFQPPLRKDLPKGKFGDSVRRGERLFTHTLDFASRYIGDGLTCANCHLNKGRQPNSAPLWAAWVLYPKYRGKNHRVNSMADRIRGCLTYSENAQDSPAGKAPAPGSPVITDLESYMFWLATGAPTGKKMKGQGYPKLKKPAKHYDPGRGAKVFAANCALCHGSDGQGTKVGKHYVFPPLWGPHSFNWGAGMHRVNSAAAFIKANMPLGKPDSLSDQDAWDVAAFVDSHERPQDPRFKGSVAKTAKKYHQHMGYYGKKVHGRVLGKHPAESKHH